MQEVCRKLDNDTGVALVEMISAFGGSSNMPLNDQSNHVQMFQKNPKGDCIALHCDISQRKLVIYLDECKGFLNIFDFVGYRFTSFNIENTSVKIDYFSKVYNAPATSMINAYGKVKVRVNIDVNTTKVNGVDILASKQIKWKPVTDKLLEEFPGYVKRSLNGEE